MSVCSSQLPQISYLNGKSGMDGLGKTNFKPLGYAESLLHGLRRPWAGIGRGRSV